MDTEARARCESVVQSAGITAGHTVLDFGCGVGNYTIPAARLVGDRGTVYAVDSDESKLKGLTDRAQREQVDGIIHVLRTNGELTIPLPSASLDAVLLYDVFWYFPLGARLQVLLKEAHRLLKSKGLLSVLPKHIDAVALKHEVESTGFHLQRRTTTEVFHDDHLESGDIFTFRKAPPTVQNQRTRGRHG